MATIPFPARAGLNRPQMDVSLLVLTVPRTRGAEPDKNGNTFMSFARSPHARG